MKPRLTTNSTRPLSACLSSHSSASARVNGIGGRRASSCDVVVIGGGPAGCAAAIGCAQRGLRVALLERSTSAHDSPGESLHPGVEPLLRQLGVDGEVLDANFLRHRGNWVQWEGPLRFVPFGVDTDGPWAGFQARRATFDAILLERARRCGVKVLQPCRALHPHMEAGRVSGLATSAGPLCARFVIDAMGGQHWLARNLGLRIKTITPRLIARYGYVECDCPTRRDAPAIVAHRDGWIWTARVREHVYQWVYLPLTTCHEIDADWLPEEFLGLKRLGPARGADVSWRMVEGAAGEGYFLAGDAASVLDPSASHGVLKALMSGMMAAHLCASVTLYKVAEHEAIQTYERWLRDWFSKDVEKLCQLYSLLPSPPDWLRCASEHAAFNVSST